jgi:superfamily II DNA or RNA helicase
MARRVRGGDNEQADLFSVGRDPQLGHALSALPWPDSDRFPVNHAGAHVWDLVWSDLTRSRGGLVVAGFASIAKIVELVAARASRAEPGHLRVLLGTEPFSTERVSFGSVSASFTTDVRQYWVEQRGVSLRLSAKIVQALRALDEGWLEVRFVPGRTRLHAKIYLGDAAVTIGSSNFTDAGLRSQFEANARFDRAGDRRRFDETAELADNYWQVGQVWDEELRALLLDLLQFVPWQEALARACADLLDGQWADRYLGSGPGLSNLWPSQLAGIAEAMWVVENVGSVLIADATGSGKTRMGAQLTRAVRDRLWSTGRVRGDLTVLVCPPSVEEQWLRESVACGLTLRTVSHGLLSRPSVAGRRVEEDEVGKAQILAVDEAHNFLAKSKRTRQIQDANADHVLLFTATPINRGAEDLLALIDLLGADNFQDDTLDLLDQLGKRGHDSVLTDAQQVLLRKEIQRFTVRRTKTMLNDLVDQDPEAYLHPITGRVCRYPVHIPRTYETGETEADQEVAQDIRAHALALKGLSLLGAELSVPATLRHDYTDERWLSMRLNAAAGLAAHHVLSAMRSSAAALLEHLVGTEEAVRALGVTGLNKPQATGATIAKVERLADQGPPRMDLDCEVPDWLSDGKAWRGECSAELAHYNAMHQAARRLGNNRERAKAALISELAANHERILAFDRHPITIAAIGPLIDAGQVQVITATGADTRLRKQVRARFAADSVEPGIALCTDAMSEGLNLQGASVIVHFDFPTTLRVAEQRVGRVDRMDSPYAQIEAWWPDDSAAFATRANELLTARSAESAALLGSNLPMPNLAHRRDGPVDVQLIAETVEAPRTDVWDGIRDALDPVRGLVSGPEALVSAAEYATHRGSTHRVLARVAPIESDRPWAFFAVRAHANGAPRWILLDGHAATVAHGLDDVTAGLRKHLLEDPPARDFDHECEHWLNHFLTAATKSEAQLIPRRLQRALDQMHMACLHWARDGRRNADFELADRWEALAKLADTRDGENAFDFHQVAERWLRLIQPLREQVRRNRQRRSRYSRIRDVDPLLRSKPLELNAIESSLKDIHQLEPFDQRVTACILAVPRRSSTVAAAQ